MTSETKRERAIRLARKAEAYWWREDYGGIERLISLARAEAFEEAWNAISAMIEQGHLPLAFARFALAELKDKEERDDK